MSGLHSKPQCPELIRSTSFFFPCPCQVFPVLFALGFLGSSSKCHIGAAGGGVAGSSLGKGKDPRLLQDRAQSHLGRNRISNRPVLNWGRELRSCAVAPAVASVWGKASQREVAGPQELPGSLQRTLVGPATGRQSLAVSLLQGQPCQQRWPCLRLPPPWDNPHPKWARAVPALLVSLAHSLATHSFHLPPLA